MELRTVDGKACIAFKQGKGEVVQTSADAIKQARKRISDALFMLHNLATTRASEQARLEDALESGISTAGARKELATIVELETDQTREISDAENDIHQIESLIDQHRAEEITQASLDAVKNLIFPFKTFLEQYHG